MGYFESSLSRLDRNNTEIDPYISKIHKKYRLLMKGFFKEMFHVLFFKNKMQFWKK